MRAAYSQQDAFSATECTRIVALSAEAGLRAAGLVGQVANHNIRRAEIAWLDEVPGAEWVMERLMGLVATANREAFDFALTEFSESPQVARYGAEVEGHFGWHSDIGDGVVARNRKLTLVVQLSLPEDYEGGVLELMPDVNILAADRTQGAVVLFPSFTLHRVTPVTKGTRHSLTVWAHGPAFR